MHKRTHLTVTENRSRAYKKRANRRRHHGNRTLKIAALCLFVAEVGALLFFNPALRVTRVRVEGAQTLTTQHVFAEARIPNHTNIFWMLRQPFARRLTQDPMIDHATRTIRLPNLLILTVTERQPRAVLASRGQFWLLDPKGVPYQQLDRPQPGIPIVQVSSKAMPDTVTLGKPLRVAWLPDVYALLTLLHGNSDLTGAKITVDQNLNLCLNRKDNLQIRLGQADSLPQKVALADAVVSVRDGALARQAAYLDVSSLQQPVYKPRPDLREDLKDNDGSESRAN